LRWVDEKPVDGDEYEDEYNTCSIACLVVGADVCLYVDPVIYLDSSLNRKAKRFPTSPGSHTLAKGTRAKTSSFPDDTAPNELIIGVLIMPLFHIDQLCNGLIMTQTKEVKGRDRA
jgi:hypothetical protein